MYQEKPNPPHQRGTLMGASQDTSHHRLTGLTLTLMMSVACGDAAPAPVPPTATVRALWDPQAALVPTPTDLARDASRAQLALPIEANMPLAEREFRSYLNSLDGYPVTSTVNIPLSGALAAESVPGTGVLVALDTDTRVEAQARYDDASQQVQLIPAPGSLQPGQRYAYGLRGYEGGARGASGELLVADAAFYLVRSREALEDHPSALPGATREARRQAAAQLGALQRAYDATLRTITSYGIPREQLAVVGEFTVSARPTLWFDAASGQIPMPNDLVRDAQTGRVALPSSPQDSPEVMHVKAELGRYDGFSATGAITIKASAPLDRESALRAEHVRLFRTTDSGEVIEHDDLERGVLDDGVTLWVRPRLALEHSADYVYVVSRELRARDGQRFEPQPVSALLRGAGALEVEGRSQVSALDDASAARLEPVRQRVNRALGHLVTRGTTRDNIALTAPFRTTSSYEPMLARRAALYRDNVRVDVVNTLTRSPAERGLLLLMPSVRTIVTGQLTVRDYLDPVTLAMREDGQPQERGVDFVLTLPRSAQPGQPVPVVVFGHGLETSRELLYLIAQSLADAGFAAISMDLPYHGNRSICLKDSDCQDNGSCDARHQCVNTDGSPGELLEIASIWPDGPRYPITSGIPFIDLAHIEASRDHFTQAILDINQLVRVVRGADWAQATGGYTLDGQDMVYLGMSLGGILGANLSVVEPTLTTFALNVPGAGFAQMVQSSAAFSTLFDAEVAARQILPGSDAFFQFIQLVRWLLDPVDPVNIAHHAILAPITYDDPVSGQEVQAPVKRVMIQMARQDSVVPNISTRILSERMGVPLREYTPTLSNHAFLFDPTSLEGRRARRDVLDFFEQR